MHTRTDRQIRSDLPEPPVADRSDLPEPPVRAPPVDQIFLNRRFLRRTSNRRMRERDAAAEQIEERQSDWACSRPIVILDLLWNFAFVFVPLSVLVPKLYLLSRAQLVILCTWLVESGDIPVWDNGNAFIITNGKTWALFLGKLFFFPPSPCILDTSSIRFPRFYPLSPHIRKINLSPSEPSLSLLLSSSQLEVKFYRSRKTIIAETVGGDSGVPTLTPLQAGNVEKPSKQKVAAIVGGVGAALLVVITGVIVYFCLMRLKRLIRGASDTASSVPSPPVAWEMENIPPSAGAVSPYDTYNLRQLSILELEHATGNFNQINIIGEGSFGLVYKGLLDDGSVVAIKRHLHYPVQYFLNEVKRIALVNHKHLVKLIGYCEENHQQFLVYDYLPNGNVGNHLYDSEGLPIGKLEMRQRLLIALGAAKGLEYLHSLTPSILHMHFRTRNVLVDENFTVKVSDFGLSKLLEGYHAESSSAFDFFHDPELRLSKDFSDRSDVYSFGVFLLELISGRDALGRNQSDMQENLVLQAKGIHDLNDFVDKTVRDHTMHAVKQMMDLALLCIDMSIRRPAMKSVVEELERIQVSDFGNLHSGMGEDIGIVTLGSELFK